MMPSVTVVVSIFNGSKFIEGAIRYLGQQEYRDFEVIFVVDLKTNDDTMEKIETFAKVLSDYKVIMQNDKDGLAGARNIGLDAAVGKYVWFMDVDDRPYPDFLSIMVKLVEDNDADMSTCNYIRSLDREIEEIDKKFKVKVMDREQTMKGLMSDKVPVVTWSKLIRTEFLRNNGLRFCPGFAEDIEHTYRMMNVCSKTVYCSKPLYVYHQNPTSIVLSIGNKRGKEEVRVYRELIDEFQGTDMAERVGVKSAIMILRSSVHMDYETFREYIKSSEFREIGDKFLKNPVSLEYVCARISPKLYYLGLHFYLKFFYYRDLRCYTKI